MAWRSTRRQIVWAVGIAATLLILVSIGVWLWDLLAGYIRPKTPTDKKDLVNIFVVIAAGVVGTLTAIAAVGNLIISRRNLQHAQNTLQQQRDLEDRRAQQQRDLDERRAQDDALQAYYTQIGDLLTDHDLMNTDREDDPRRLLARAQSLTVLKRLEATNNRATRNKRDVIRFLYNAGLIRRHRVIVDLATADLRSADLTHTYLSDANLRYANLRYANLKGVDLRGANLRDANLRDADLSDADLSDADLSDADLRLAKLKGALVTEEQLSTCRFLKQATMPDGQKYEEWIKDREDRGKGAHGTDTS
jgi:uncharacterized protein YjbI with pentapeptide repeats